MKVGGRKKRIKEEKLSKETLDMMKQRREMKQTNNIHQIEHTETCKTIRKKMKEEIWQFNTRKIEQTVEENKSLKTAKRKLVLPGKVTNICLEI